MEEKLNSIPEFMLRLKVSRSMAFQMLKEQQIRSVTIGRRRFVKESDLIAYLDGLSAPRDDASDVAQ